MSEKNEEKVNVHAHLRNMLPETPDEYKARMEKEMDEMDASVRRVQELLKEGKNPADEFPYWGH